MAFARSLGIYVACILLCILSCAAQSKPIFEQDLKQFGCTYKWDDWEKNKVHYQFTDLAFLSDNLLLLSVKEISEAELNQQGEIDEALRRGEMPHAPKRDPFGRLQALIQNRPESPLSGLLWIKSSHSGL